MKKLITTLLLVTFIMTCSCSGLVPVFAQSGIAISDSGINNISATGYSSCAGTASDGGVGGAEYNNVSFQATEWLEYELNVQTAGLYNIYITYGTTSALTLSVTLNGNKLQNVIFQPTAGYTKYTTEFAMRIQLESGLNTVRVTNEAGSAYFRTIGFELLKDIDVEAVLTDTGVDIISGDVRVPRGCDSFTIKFNQAFDTETFTDESVKLLKGEEELPIIAEADGSQLMVKLKKTLDYETDYTIVLENISDVHGLSAIESASVSFTTAGTSVRTGNATVELSAAGFSGSEFDITAVMKSKAGVPIEGRNAEIYALTPQGALIETPLCSALSGEGGIISLKGSLPEGSLSGLYNLILFYEYSKADIYIEMIYVSPEKEEELIGELETAADAVAVEEFFTENYAMLGISLTADTEGIDADKLYAYFVTDKPDSIDGLLNQYYTSLAMEKINQATDEAAVLAVLGDEELCSYLGIAKGKADLISVGRSGLAAEILELGEITDKVQFKETVQGIIDLWYAAEYAKTDSEPSAEGMDVYVNQAITLDLGFVLEADDVIGATFVFESSDGDIFDGAVVDEADSFSAETERDGNTLKVILSAEEGVDTVKSLGTLSLTNTAEAGSYEITVSGSVSYDVGTDYEANADITSKQIEISISRNTNKGNSGMIAESSGSNRGSGGGGSSVIAKPEPTVTPEPTEEPTQEAPTYEFSDVDSVEWAKESIYSLLEEGVISESSDKKFNPNNNVTRAEFVKMIVIAFGLTDDAAACTLNDVTADMWYYPFAAAAQKQGLITGDEKGNFNANDNITRQDMAVVIFRVCQKLGYGFTEDEFGEAFSDEESISAYAKEAVYSMRIMGIINGVGENMFAPRNFATRAQAAKIIYETVKAVGI